MSTTSIGFGYEELAPNRRSVMDQVRAVDAKPTTLSASLVKGRSLTTRCIPKGIYSFHPISPTSLLINCRYVEMLEQQQSQLVTGLQVLYKRLQAGEGWPGLPLDSHGGQPLTHDILERLDLLHSASDASMTHEDFDEDLASLKRRCLADHGSSPNHRRRRSPSEESEPSLISSRSSRGMASPHSLSMPDSLSQRSSPATPFMDSPYLQSAQLSAPVKPQQYAMQSMVSPMDLESQWLSQQNLLEEVDMGFGYNSTVAFDPVYTYPTQEPEAMSSTMWNDSYMDFLQPNMVV